MTAMTVDNTLVLVIDIQEKLVPAMHDSDTYLANLQFLLEGLNHLGVKKVVTEQYPQGLGATHPDIKSYLTEAPVYAKTRFNACIPEVLNHITPGIEHMVIIGMETPICVEQTAHQLLEDYPQVQVTLVRDAVTARSAQEHEWALSQLQADGATLLSSESLLYRLLEDAKNPHFKAISNLVKERQA
ncbi:MULTISPECIES: isochorismatase family protein [Aerococcus]|uniref:isochorismatase family protein n=1 Tax=Aerococcus urinae (strain CCUG 59500 / ACS-120-V-Col10a) TaxID=2976812 RepID=UPI000200F3D5|nr:isochorismatase family protein [Aerococcus sp. Group 1]AEA00475.1 isochorismatase family protein [Aerococcus sp. Group 1]MCY3030342.1 isochorismatase family protein [Aerococcus sp. Group 1]MCY3055439.1 isochorismatase family protein [Aerococcus sp. Group 1]MCY3057169.1 isochorismatase family protein [Aerococcus sp. Group 1]MCY3061531.1 isochorismatase family protein [Aerococcus sp. Group 1]